MIFLTPSCSEYSSPDIAEYLHKVNNVPSTYNIRRLCTEDPLSVSRQFSYQFTAKSGPKSEEGLEAGKLCENLLFTMCKFIYRYHHVYFDNISKV